MSLCILILIRKGYTIPRLRSTRISTGRKMPRKTKIIALIGIIYSSLAWSSPVVVGQLVPPITLEGDLGGKVSGEPWHSDEIAKQGKVISLFYVDPEEKN